MCHPMSIMVAAQEVTRGRRTGEVVGLVDNGTGRWGNDNAVWIGCRGMRWLIIEREIRCHSLGSEDDNLYYMLIILLLLHCCTAFR